jgi:hypothetical protein
MKNLLRRTKLYLKFIILPRWYIFVLFGICFGTALYFSTRVYDSINENIQQRIENGQSMVSVDRESIHQEQQ